MSVQPVRGFPIDGYQTRFILKNLDEADSPLRVLERIMGYLMDEARHNSEEAGFEVTHLGVAFEVEGMVRDFLIPFRPPEENNAAKVSQALDDFDQSDTVVSLYDKDLSLKLTCVKKPRGAGRCPFIDDEAECSDDDDDDDEDVNDSGEEEVEEGAAVSRDSRAHPRRSRLIVNSNVPVHGPQQRRGGPGAKKLQYIPGKSIVENALIRIPKYDNKCLFHAIYVAQQYHRVMRLDVKNRAQIAYHRVHRLVNNHNRLSEAAESLMENSGILQGQPDYGLEDVKKVQTYLNIVSPEEWNIVVFCEGRSERPYHNEKFNHRHHICLYHNNGHFDVIKSPAQFFDRKFYCIACQTPYADPASHTRHCAFKCSKCLRMGCGHPCKDDPVWKIKCHSCNRWFYNEHCYEEHKKHACNRYKVCPRCNCVFRPKTDRWMSEHRCGGRMCRICHRYHLKHEKCHIPQLEINPDLMPYRLAGIDFESEIHKKIDGRRELHEPNYVSIHITCTACIAKGRWDDFDRADCNVCGPKKHWKFGAWELSEGWNVADGLLELLLAKLPPGYKTYAYAHNGAKYDVHFILKAVCRRRGILPKVISTGNKIMELRIPKTRRLNAVTFRDSCLLFPMKLSEVPKTFNLRRKDEPIKPKMHFPYLSNDAKNYGIRMEQLPPKEDYLPDKMSSEERVAFDEWYEKHKNDGFDLCKELEEYCSNDTLILIHAIVTFRELFNSAADGKDVFIRACTITGGCLRLFKTKFLKEDTLGVVPNNGYMGGDLQSGKALAYLKWFGWKHNVKVQHRDSTEGEWKTNNKAPHYFRLDGHIPVAERLKPDFQQCDIENCPYCNDPDSRVKDTALEYHGCSWHGCRKCFPNVVILPNGKKSDEALERTEERDSRIIASGFNLVSVWECQVDAELKVNPEMKEFCEKCCHDTGPIHPRDAFFGGRVHPTRLYSGPTPDTRKRHCDVVSLYPSVLRKDFPVGHPKFERFDWKDGEVFWDKPSDVPYFGLIKCLVLPPKKLFLPVLPFRDDHRLVFPLCKRCTIESRRLPSYGLKQCIHTDEQREFTTTTTHFELKLALEHGYKVKRLFEVWDYWTKDDNIFRGYINTFMKIKVEATGWEKNGVDKKDEIAKDRFVAEYLTREGIHIDKNNVHPNPGLRYIAKQCLNRY